MNRDELWKKYHSTKDKRLKQLLIEEYVGLVKIVAGRMYNYYGSKVDYDDLIGFGMIGLIDSVERFDINKNIKFETYAQIRIKGTIIDNIRKLDWIPRSLRKKSKEIQSGMKKLENKLGRTPSNRELSEYLDISLEELESALADISNFNVASLEDLLINNCEHNIDSDLDRNSPEQIYEIKEIKEILGKIIDNLSESEKMVISLYYYDELTYKEIGHIMELSESRISQIHSKAILNIKNQLIKQGIYDIN
ncbi:MAG: FliA/WhiG family RNA polymerase sigma factor [Tissierellia bacterium]|nr:FliA/WhiG family RNA polymerase sigma factor [Tissierellia bacterium]